MTPSAPATCADTNITESNEGGQRVALSISGHGFGFSENRSRIRFGKRLANGKRRSRLFSRLFRKIVCLLGFIGERGGNRTHDPLIKSQMLYLLSYALDAIRARHAYSLTLHGSRRCRR